MVDSRDVKHRETAEGKMGLFDHAEPVPVISGSLATGCAESAQIDSMATGRVSLPTLRKK